MARDGFPGGKSWSAWGRLTVAMSLGCLWPCALPAASSAGSASTPWKGSSHSAASNKTLAANGRPHLLYISSPFGWRNDPVNGAARPHEGIDLPGRFGSAIHATGDGVVSYAGWMTGYGNLVQIDHAGGLRTRYGHLSTILVRPGEPVERGEVIGRLGSTGRSTGNHLHYEVRRSGQPVDPLAYIDHQTIRRSLGHQHHAQSDMVQLGSTVANGQADARWRGFTDTSEGLPQAIIR